MAHGWRYNKLSFLRALLRAARRVLCVCAVQSFFYGFPARLYILHIFSGTCFCVIVFCFVFVVFALFFVCLFVFCSS